MSSTFKNNKPLDFTKNEENSKNNIDYFNLLLLKEDRVKDNIMTSKNLKKTPKCFIRYLLAAVFIVAFLKIAIYRIIKCKN